jgi:flagellar hook protein FlgE
MSFYTSLSGLKNAQTELNVVANNISNAETNGFKKSRVAFGDMISSTAFTSPTMVAGIGSKVEAINQNFGVGPVEQTGGSLDVAIGGEGFFTVKSAATGETMFTRNGAFTADESGFINDGQGNRLQVFPAGTAAGAGAAADAQIPAANAAGAAFAGVTIDAAGQVKASYADGSTTAVGTVALASFVSPTGLKQVGSSNWVATGISGAPSYGTPGAGVFGDLQAGAVERSNVDIAEELVNLITAQRYFQANAKAIDTATQISQTIINMRS